MFTYLRSDLHNVYEGEPLVALDSQQKGAEVLHPQYPTLGKVERGSGRQCQTDRAVPASQRRARREER